LNDDEKYIFDLNGYRVLRGVLSPEQVARCNEAIDRHADQLVAHERQFEGDSKALASDVRQHWLSGMLGWDRPWCEPFRELLVHARVRPYLTEILGAGYRLNEGPDLVTMTKGCAGHYLHGGGIERPDFTQTYMWKHGKIYCGMTVVEFMLSDERPGDGGLAVIPGGHKSNYPLPEPIMFYEEHQELVTELHVKAGDAVIFVEACTHGTLKWNADHQRRTMIYRYTPGFMEFGSKAPDSMVEMTEEERSVMHSAR
jgi:ectoine hydroxylase-related dioxygenase (phytanoyl-CoA dioxygenase family)